MPTLMGRDPATGRAIRVETAAGIISRVREVESTTDCWIAPGFVDLQINGYSGIDLNTGGLEPESVLSLTRLLAAAGTTTYLPTITTDSQGAMAERLRVIASAHSAYAEVRHAVAGVHVEGPHLSPRDGYRGAHPAEHVRPPSLAEFEELQSAASGLIRMVTLSPHWTAVTAFIRALTARGIIVALGHTDANSQQIHEASEAGATLSTHLGNGIASQLDRHPNPIWTQLADDRLTATFIADGAHLSADTLRVMFRVKTAERAILVSDSVALAGAAPGEYSANIGGNVTVHADGSIRMRGSQLLAGSGIALKDAVARTPALAGCTLAESVRMATRNPAAALGISAGSLSVGSRADLVVFQWSIRNSTMDIQQVMAAGRIITA